MASSLASFDLISPRTSLYTPEKPAAGQLIILCTWLGAAQKHISKYTTLYKSIAPNAHILLIQSDVTILTSSYERQQTALQPAISSVLSMITSTTVGTHHDNTALPPDPAPKPILLLHTFSNGGTNTAAQLLIGLRTRMQSRLPLTGLICDSGPAKGTYWKSYDAVVLSIPSGVQRLFGAVVAHCILLSLYSWIAWGNENPADLQRRVLLDAGHDESSGDESTSPENSVRGTVCYVYSKADRMCDWTDVRDHAEEARGKRWEVKEVCFEDSGHCAHLSRYPGEYTEAVREMWGSC